MLARPEDVEEAAQEALARAWRSRSRCATAPDPWLARIARNEALRVLERRSRLSERERPDSEFVELRSGDPSGLDGVLDSIAFEQTISPLSPPERELARLRYVDDLSHPEVAERLGVPEGTIKVRLHRMRNRLRGLMEEEYLETAG